jgi:hypothetical protein
MDPNGNIYEGENVPAEDKARLDGFLRGRAEGDAEKRAALVDAQAALEQAEKKQASECGVAVCDRTATQVSRGDVDQYRCDTHAAAQAEQHCWEFEAVTADV